MVESFITALRTCSISPFVIIDGGIDVSGKKNQTVAKRTKASIQKAHQAAEEGSQQGILPLLATLVFKQTLVRLKVEIIVCYEEADQELASLAKEWDCPVLSSDSDFYIFDLPAGTLPYSHFQWRALEQRDSGSYIPSKNYRAANFCYFFGIQKQLLPTFAALAGNDFVNLKSLNWGHFSPAHVKKRRHLWGLLSWLKRFEVPEEALAEALKQMQWPGSAQLQVIRKKFEVGIQEYKLPSSRLIKFFRHGIPPPFPEVSTGTAISLL